MAGSTGSAGLSEVDAILVEPYVYLRTPEEQKMPEQQGSGSPFSVTLNYSDTAPGTESNARPADRGTESAGAGVTTQPVTGDTHESGQNETAGGAETGQAPGQ